MLEALKGIYESSAFSYIIDGFMDGGWKYLVMYGIVAVLFYLGIVRKFEPLLLLPIAFGMLLTNIPTLSDAIFHMEFFVQSDGAVINWGELGAHGGLLDYLYLGVKLGIFPPLIFLGVGAMTDFSPLIANPKSLLLSAAAQFGVFAAFIGALLLGFTVPEAASIGIIGGADGPTAIYVTKTLAPALLGAIAVAAYSYMALVPMIQPPIMKALTTKKERMVKMDVLRPVSKTEQVIFPIVVALVVSAILPSALSLVGMLMLGNLLRVSGVTERLSKTAQNELMNIVTIMLGVCVGATAKADTFLDPKTLYIILLGLCAFAFATLAGVLFGKLMYIITGGKINPLIGSAGVSAVPMAARVSQKVGQAENPSNFLLMHAMGPNVAGVIGSAVAAGVFLTLFQ
jgi:oxaloacetate decarboxylase beta subunit